MLVDYYDLKEKETFCQHPLHYTRMYIVIIFYHFYKANCIACNMLHLCLWTPATAVSFHHFYQLANGPQQVQTPSMIWFTWGVLNKFLQRMIQSKQNQTQKQTWLYIIICFWNWIEGKQTNPCLNNIHSIRPDYIFIYFWNWIEGKQTAPCLNDINISSIRTTHKYWYLFYRTYCCIKQFYMKKQVRVEKMHSEHKPDIFNKEY